VVFVKEISRNDPDFYSQMGRFFGSRKIASEVGIHIYDDQDKRWFVAVDSEIIGFASVRNALVSDCYVIPEKRSEGVFKCILSSILIFVPGRLKANCTNASKKAFIDAGFVETRKSKNYTFMELNNA